MIVPKLMMIYIVLGTILLSLMAWLGYLHHRHNQTPESDHLGQLNVIFFDLLILFLITSGLNTSIHVY